MTYSPTIDSRLGYVTAREVTFERKVGSGKNRRSLGMTTTTTYDFHVDDDCADAQGLDVVERDVTARGALHSSLSCETCVLAASTFERVAGEDDEERRTFGSGSDARRAPAASPVKRNRYAGACSKCGGRVEAEAGLLGGRPGAWTVEHEGACPPPPAPVAVPTGIPGEDGTPPLVVEERGEAPEGMHRTADGTIYKVQRAVHGSGNVYAKRLVVIKDALLDETTGRAAVDENGKLVDAGEVEFVYEPGAIRLLSTATAMSVDEAKAFGALYGVCCVCAATLTDEGSIRAGIGPVCGGRLTEWLTGVKLTKAQFTLLDEIRDAGGRLLVAAKRGRSIDALGALGLVTICQHGTEVEVTIA